MKDILIMIVIPMFVQSMENALLTRKGGQYVFVTRTGVVQLVMFAAITGQVHRVQFALNHSWELTASLFKNNVIWRLVMGKGPVTFPKEI